MGFNPVDLAFGHMNALQSGNERLKAENDKLRVELTDLRLKSCPSCGIKVENEKLRHELAMDTFSGLGEIEAYKREASVAARKLAQAEAENEKLRELARDMWEGMCGYGHDCRGCEHYELHDGQRFVGECEYHRRMRELGVEL